MSQAVAVSVLLDADPRNVSRARAMLRETLARSGAEHLLDPAVVVLSEVVTNAFVHVGGTVHVHVRARSDWVRCEVEDGSTELPSLRHYGVTAGTGRGLQLMDDLADRWGTTRSAHGKMVWFEVGAGDAGHEPGPDTIVDAAHSRVGPALAASEVVPVTLREVPLLMHLAWQEHAATLLREYLLHALDDDEHILENHARASAAMSLLHDQLPAPPLPDEGDALMADAIEPRMTADEVVLRIPAASVSHFEMLDELLREAIAEARVGVFLSPPTQPEIDEMREWICLEVARQAAGATTARPWLARTDVRATLVDQAVLSATYSDLAAVSEPLLATNEASIVVAASQSALDLLGYERAADLLGRRVLVVVPTRFHQAHIAGTTLHATNGRDNLLGVPVTVPMVCADGSEVQVQLTVRPEQISHDQRVFVATFRRVGGERSTTSRTADGAPDGADGAATVR